VKRRTSFPLRSLCDVLVEVPSSLSVRPSRTRPEMERSRQDAVRGRDDLDEVSSGDLDRGYFVGRESDEVGELEIGRRERLTDVSLLAERTKRKERGTNQTAND
jgi:hypothetical protein